MPKPNHPKEIKELEVVSIVLTTLVLIVMAFSAFLFFRVGNYPALEWVILAAMWYVLYLWSHRSSTKLLKDSFEIMEMQQSLVDTELETITELAT